MAGDMLIRGRDGTIAVENLECNPHILHLLFHCILPNNIVILLVQSYAVSPGLGHLNTKLEVPLVRAFGHSGYDMVPLIEGVRYPPYKIRFILEFLSGGILSHFHWISLLEIRKMFTTCGTFLPLNTQVPTNSCLLHLQVASMLDVHISTSDRMAVSSVIHNVIHQVLMVYLFIALCKHFMGNHIGSVLVGTPIWKLDLIGPCFQHCIGVSHTIHGSIELTIMTCHPAIVWLLRP
jgi:hypothetical protein